MAFQSVQAQPPCLTKCSSRAGTQKRDGACRGARSTNCTGEQAHSRSCSRWVGPRNHSTVTPSAYYARHKLLCHPVWLQAAARDSSTLRSMTQTHYVCVHVAHHVAVLFVAKRSGAHMQVARGARRAAPRGEPVGGAVARFSCSTPSPENEVRPVQQQRLLRPADEVGLRWGRSGAS